MTRHRYALRGKTRIFVALVGLMTTCHHILSAAALELLDMGLEIPLSPNDGTSKEDDLGFRISQAFKDLGLEADDSGNAYDRRTNNLIIGSWDTGRQTVYEVRPSPMNLDTYPAIAGPIYAAATSLGLKIFWGGGHIHVNQTPFRRNPDRFVSMLVRIHNNPGIAKFYNPLVSPAMTLFEMGWQNEFIAAVAEYQSGPRTWNEVTRLFKDMLVKGGFLRMTESTIEIRGINPAATLVELGNRLNFIQRIWDTTTSEIATPWRWDFSDYVTYLHTSNFTQWVKEMGLSLPRSRYEQDLRNVVHMRQLNERGSGVEYVKTAVALGVPELDRLFAIPDEKIRMELVQRLAKLEMGLHAYLALGSEFFANHRDLQLAYWQNFKDVRPLIPHLSASDFDSPHAEVLLDLLAEEERVRGGVASRLAEVAGKMSVPARELVRRYENTGKFDLTDDPAPNSRNVRPEPDEIDEWHAEIAKLPYWLLAEEKYRGLRQRLLASASRLTRVRTLQNLIGTHFEERVKDIMPIGYAAWVDEHKTIPPAYCDQLGLATVLERLRDP